jgi:DNA repair photolyase
MAISPVQVKSILQKSGLPETSYVINPYTGCVHGCVYCYARFMKRFTAHPEPWGTFLDAKVNAAEVLKRQLERRKEPLQEVVFLSSVTDPYQSAEKKYRLTRSILEVLLEYQVPISILTKSDLVLRDSDLLKQFNHCKVGLSLMTLDDELAHHMEPRAVPPARRLKALQALHEQGIYTYAFISPYLPRMSDIQNLIESLVGSVDEVGLEAINTRGDYWRGVEAVLANRYPEALEDCKRLSNDDSFWLELEGRLNQLVDRYQITKMGFYRH